MKIRSIKMQPADNSQRKHTKIFVFYNRKFMVADFRKTCLNKVLRKIKTPVGFPVSWNKLCGCKCGCAPGFDVKNNGGLDVFVTLW